jgi:thymidylate synthase
MNKLDKQYTDLLQNIIDNGVIKSDRTGTGTFSVFGRQIRHSMKNGFPLLTTKKVAFKTMAKELLWFLRGDTNIKFLVDNNCHVWDGDAYKAFQARNGKCYCSHTTTCDCGDISQSEFIERIKTDVIFANKWGELGPIYGKQWRSWKVGKGIETTLKNDDGDTIYEAGSMYIDQITNLINEIKINPDSRRLMVNAWNVGELDKMTLPPCHYGFQVYTRELSIKERFELAKFNWPPGGLPNIGIARLDELNIPTRAISLMWNQRSVDTFLGLPFNIASYGLLLELISKVINMVPDELIGNLGDVHLYSNHIEQAKEQISREPFELPKLNINTEFWMTEGGSCGEGPLNASAIFDLFTDDNFCKCLLEEDIQLGNYQSHPTIKAPLSN